MGYLNNPQSSYLQHQRQDRARMYIGSRNGSNYQIELESMDLGINLQRIMRCIRITIIDEINPVLTATTGISAVSGSIINLGAKKENKNKTKLLL